MEAFDSAQSPSEVYSKAMDLIVQDLSPERSFILTRHNGSWVSQAAHGLDGENVLASGEISLQPLRHVLADGEPVMLLDALEDPEYSGRMSVNLAGIRSVVCVPWRDHTDQVVGILYADDRARRSAFLEDNLAWLLGLADSVRRRLASLAGHELSPSETLANSGEEEGLGEWDTNRRVGHRLLKAGKVGKAEQKFKLALRLAGKAEGDQSLAVAKCYRSMARVYRVQHRFDECREVLEKAANIFLGLGLKGDVARCLNTLAGGYYAEAQWDRAEPLYQRAVSFWQEEDPSHKMLAPALTHLGDIQARRAENFYQRAYQIASEALGQDHSITRKTGARLERLGAVNKIE